MIVKKFKNETPNKYNNNMNNKFYKEPNEKKHYFECGWKFTGIHDNNGKPKEGKMTFHNGEIFDGICENGVPSHGKLYYNDRWTFKGTFMHGMPNRGILIDFVDDECNCKFNEITLKFDTF